MLDFRVLALVFAAVVGCHSHSFKMGACPKVKVMKDFEMSQFVGEWFVIGRYNPMATCTKVFVDKTPDGVFTAEESSRPFGFNFGLYHHRRPRKLIIVKNNTDAIFKIPHQFKPFGLNTYGILDTDYENYAVVWGCDPVLMGSMQNLDVFARSPDSEENVEIMKNAKDLAEKAGIETHALGKVEHANCVNTKKGGPNTISVPDHGMEVEE